MNDDTDLDGEPLDSAGIPVCPFCASAARYFGPMVSGGKPRYLWEIQCRGCHVSMQGEGETSEEAKAAVLVRWSRRVTDSRLAMLDAWFESRGLPKGYPHLDHWRWIIMGFIGGKRAMVAHTVVCATDDEAMDDAKEAGVTPFDAFRWDCISPEWRAEALRLVAEKAKSAQP